MVRLYVRHAVEDFDAWKQHYDDFDAERRSMGARDDGVYRRIDDGNDVTVWHDFADRDRAASFVGSERLRDVMADAGVVGKPEAWVVEEA